MSNEQKLRTVLADPHVSGTAFSHNDRSQPPQSFTTSTAPSVGEQSVPEQQPQLHARPSMRTTSNACTASRTRRVERHSVSILSVSDATLTVLRGIKQKRKQNIPPTTALHERLRHARPVGLLSFYGRRWFWQLLDTPAVYVGGECSCHRWEALARSFLQLESGHKELAKSSIPVCRPAKATIMKPVLMSTS